MSARALCLRGRGGWTTCHPEWDERRPSLEPLWNLEDSNQLSRQLHRKAIFQFMQLVELVEPDGIEPTSSSMPLKRSPN